MIRTLATLVGAACIGASIFAIAFMAVAPLFVSALVSALADTGLVLLLWGEGEGQ